MGDELKKIFLNEKPVKILTKIDRGRTETYASALAQEIDATYAHTVKCMKKLEDHELITFERNGRKKEAELTDHGEILAEDFFQLLQDMTSDSDI